MISSVTRLRIRRVRYVPLFVWRTFLAQRQARRAPGFYGGKLLVDARRTFWTLTVWADERSMKQFRGSGAHAQVMPSLARWCDEAAYTHWISTDNSIPDWSEAYEKLISEGRLSRVERPSSDHEARRFAKPRLQPLIGQTLGRIGNNYKRAA
jgi:heme-degrading monooxygenase HmoA